jgi:hypothetical protein
MRELLMRIFLNFMHRGDWFVHCLAEDARTVISPHVKIKTDATLLKLLRAAGADEDTILAASRDMRQTGRGTVAMTVNETGRELLRFRV